MLWFIEKKANCTWLGINYLHLYTLYLTPYCIPYSTNRAFYNVNTVLYTAVYAVCSGYFKTGSEIMNEKVRSRLEIVWRKTDKQNSVSKQINVFRKSDPWWCLSMCACLLAHTQKQCVVPQHLLVDCMQHFGDSWSGKHDTSEYKARPMCFGFSGKAHPFTLEFKGMYNLKT